MVKDVYLTDDYQLGNLNKTEFDAWITVMRQMGEYQVIFEIFDSSISRDNSVSKEEFLSCMDKLEYLGTHLTLTEEDFDKALDMAETGSRELSCDIFS